MVATWTQRTGRRRRPCSASPAAWSTASRPAWPARGFADVRPAHGFAFARISAGRSTNADVAGPPRHHQAGRQPAGRATRRRRLRRATTRTRATPAPGCWSSPTAGAPAPRPRRSGRGGGRRELAGPGSPQPGSDPSAAPWPRWAEPPPSASPGDPSKVSLSYFVGRSGSPLVTITGPAPSPRATRLPVRTRRLARAWACCSRSSSLAAARESSPSAPGRSASATSGRRSPTPRWSATTPSIVRGLRVPRTAARPAGRRRPRASPARSCRATPATRSAIPGLLGVTAGASLAVVLAISAARRHHPGRLRLVRPRRRAGRHRRGVRDRLGRPGRRHPADPRAGRRGAVGAALRAGPGGAGRATRRPSTASASGSSARSPAGAPTSRGAGGALPRSPGVVLALANAPALNLLGLGDDVARGLGQRIWPARAIGLAAVTLLSGAATAACGPIAFVGSGRAARRPRGHRPRPPLADPLLGAARRRCCCSPPTWWAGSWPGRASCRPASCWPCSGRRSSSRSSGAAGWPRL